MWTHVLLTLAYGNNSTPEAVVEAGASLAPNQVEASVARVGGCTAG